MNELIKMEKFLSTIYGHVKDIFGYGNKSIPLPPLLRVEIPNGERTFIIKVPRNETYRVDSIIHRQEYAIEDNRHCGRKLTVFDVGANLGLYSLYLKMRYPDSRIFCFEPVPHTFELLKANLAGMPGITLNRFGLFNENKKEIIHVKPGNTGHSTIKLPLEGKVEQVKVALRDSGMYFDGAGLEHLDILKIDTEGCEVEILESLGHRLERVDYVLVESHSKRDRREIYRILRSFRAVSDMSREDGRGIIKYMNTRL